MVLVLVTVLYSTWVVVFVSKTVTYETTGSGRLVVKGGELGPLEPVPEGSRVEDESIDETKLEPVLGEGLTVAGRLLELLGDGWALCGPLYKSSCAWATAARKRVKRVP
jgi:hypothetical protein